MFDILQLGSKNIILHILAMLKIKENSLDRMGLIYAQKRHFLQTDNNFRKQLIDRLKKPPIYSVYSQF